jgi:hypothetical protein
LNFEPSMWADASRSVLPLPIQFLCGPRLGRLVTPLAVRPSNAERVAGVDQERVAMVAMSDA